MWKRRPKAENDDISRFPTLKIIVGHMGERIPSDFSRINDRTFMISH